MPPCISHQFFFPWLPLFSRLQPFFHYFNFFFMTSIFFPWLKLFLMTSTFFQDFTFPTWLQLFLMTSIFWHDFNFPAWQTFWHDFNFPEWLSLVCYSTVPINVYLKIEYHLAQILWTIGGTIVSRLTMVEHKQSKFFCFNTEGHSKAVLWWLKKKWSQRDYSSK